MKLNFLKTSLLYLSIFWVLANAQSMAMETVVKTENPFLFELTHRVNPECKGYALGTNHHFSLGIFSEPVNGLIDSAKTLFVESVHTELNANIFQELGAFANDPVVTWGGQLTPEELEDVKSIFSNAEKIDSTFSTINLTFHYLKPWAVFGLLDRAQAMLHPKYEGGMDTTLHLKFYREGKKPIGLETMQDQIRAYALPEIPNSEAIGEIKKMLKNKDKEDNNEDDHSLYLKGNLKDIEDDEWNSCESEKFINMKSTYIRNPGMINTFLGHLMPQEILPMLVAVEYPFLVDLGVAHLVGKGGFLNNASINEIFIIKRISNEGIAEDFTYIPEK